MRDVESGMIGYASAVAIRRASADVYKMVARRERLVRSCLSASAHGSFSTMYLSTAAISDHAVSSAREKANAENCSPNCAMTSPAVFEIASSEGMRAAAPEG